jgi:hypothetical protein
MQNPGLRPGLCGLERAFSSFELDGGGSEFLVCDFLFCAEPIFFVVTVLAPTCFIELVRA